MLTQTIPNPRIIGKQERIVVNIILFGGFKQSVCAINQARMYVHCKHYGFLRYYIARIAVVSSCGAHQYFFCASENRVSMGIP